MTPTENMSHFWFSTWVLLGLQGRGVLLGHGYFVVPMTSYIVWETEGPGEGKRKASSRHKRWSKRLLRHILFGCRCSTTRTCDILWRMLRTRASMYASCICGGRRGTCWSPTWCTDTSKS